MAAIEHCIHGGAACNSPESCNTKCGFNFKENERRKKLPLVKGEDGLWRKYVGERVEKSVLV